MQGMKLLQLFVCAKCVTNSQRSGRNRVKIRKKGKGRIYMIKATDAAAKKFKEISDAMGNPEELNLRYEIEPGG